MNLREHLTYANVAATLALAGVIGGGGAYAASQIGSSQIDNNSIRSADLKDGKAVKGKDVRSNSLGRRDIDEGDLQASQFAPLAGDRDVCDPLDATFVDCAATTIELESRGRLLVIATGDFFSEGAAADLDCRIAIDGVNESGASFPGEETTDNTSSIATNGFARTRVTKPLTKGPHAVAMRCSQSAPQDGRLASASIAVLGISE